MSSRRHRFSPQPSPKTALMSNAPARRHHAGSGTGPKSLHLHHVDRNRARASDHLGSHPDGPARPDPGRPAGRRLLCRAAADSNARSGALPQRARAGLGRPRCHAGLVAAGSQRRADGGTFPRAHRGNSGASREGAFRLEIKRLGSGAAGF